jgi:hypothetical protein
MKPFDIPDKCIIKYLRDKKRNPRGVIVALRRPDGTVSVHYSYCNTKTDRFNKTTALTIAFGRAIEDKPYCGFSELPRQVRHEISEFNERATKYFKVDKQELCSWM